MYTNYILDYSAIYVHMKVFLVFALHVGQCHAYTRKSSGVSTRYTHTHTRAQTERKKLNSQACVCLVWLACVFNYACFYVHMYVCVCEH